EQPSVAAAGTVLDGSTQEAPGEFAVRPPGEASPGTGEKTAAAKDAPAKVVRQAPAPAPQKTGSAPKKAAGGEAAAKKPAEPKKQAEEKKSGGAAAQPAKKGAAVPAGAGVSLRSHLSGRCIDVPAHNFSDGTSLHVWDCDNSVAQKWRFAADGTVRISDKCLDVAGANFRDGTPIQIVWCNGNAAQKFTLNGAHDLVNTVVGMCVDVKDGNRSNGAPLQLWTCNGTDSQKWST
ncbi:ricin-type beta-trefoil lectin domain protein, partial [Streptomyces sp. NPDC005899]|uniref:ricin-type beta-trefoil lectin domain protein n=1 Tax=Streptomyces sp. NPDC005899 TaxID=3155716 RepID=UPI0033C316CB